MSVLQRSPGLVRLPRLEAHRPPPGIDDDDEPDERPIGDPDDEDWDSEDDDDDDDEEPLQVRGVAVNRAALPLARSVPA